MGAKNTTCRLVLNIHMNIKPPTRDGPPWHRLPLHQQPISTRPLLLMKPPAPSSPLPHLVGGWQRRSAGLHTPMEACYPDHPGRGACGTRVGTVWGLAQARCLWSMPRECGPPPAYLFLLLFTF